MAPTELEFAGHRAARVQAGDVGLIATTSVGPRIIGLLDPDGRNALAELPEATLDCPGTGPFHLYGGHRLWAAPEVPRVTYRPDDDAVEVEDGPDGLRLTSPTDPLAGTQRWMTIAVAGEGRFTIRHAVADRTSGGKELAPWAITMLPSGGRAWLPLLEGSHDAGGFQASRSIVLWPYTSLDDPRLVLGDAAIEVRTDAPERLIDAPIKVGTALRRGWAAYWRDGVLLVKRSGHEEGSRYADLGASGQIYWNGPFGELETLGPLQQLGPGDVAEHVETWEVHLVGEEEAERLVTSGGLDEAPS